MTSYLENIILRQPIPFIIKILPLTALLDGPFSPTPSASITIRRPQLRIITDFSPVTSSTACTITPPLLCFEMISQWGSWQPQLELFRERFGMSVLTALTEYQWGVLFAAAESPSCPVAPVDVATEEVVETLAQEHLARVESEASSTVGFLDPQCFPWEL